MIIYELKIDEFREIFNYITSDNLWSNYLVLTFLDQGMESFPYSLFICMEHHKYLISQYGYFGTIHLAY